MESESTQNNKIEYDNKPTHAAAHAPAHDPVEITPNVFRLADDLYEIHIPYFHTHSLTNTYLIRSSQGDLLIDCGGNGTEATKLMSESLAFLGVDINSLSVFITHCHADHVGGLKNLWHPNMTVYSGLPSLRIQHHANMRRFNNFFPEFNEFETAHGSPVNPEQDLEAAWYTVPFDPPVTQLHEGNTLTWGSYSFKVLHTPGHERKELCLWDEEKGIFFSGDAVIKATYSNMYPPDFKQDDVAEYLNMINRINLLPVKNAYAGHGSIMDEQGYHDACEHALDHHHRRIRDVYNVVTHQPQSIIEITYAFTYQGERRRWEKYPTSLQWNLYLEVAAYLNHLACTGKIKRDEIGGKPVFSLLN